MPSRASCPRPPAVAVLAALWVSLGRGGAEAAGPAGCDSGKFSLDRDLPAGGVYWDCPVAPWPQSPQSRPPSIVTVYDPEPARPICMDKPISYSHSIPNSGAYRPVEAEHGEYLYCPPQRWLNNLHHGAIVLLYHPCAPLHERRLLSVLARSCLPEYIITSHPQLQEHMPVALVSWGRTLELSTASSPEVCDWLETTTASAGNAFGGVSRSRKYDLLLTWSAEGRPEENERSLRQCCERTISGLKTEARRRRPRYADGNMKENSTVQVSVFLTEQTNKTLTNRTGGAQNRSGTHRPSADPPPSGENQSSTLRPTTALRSNISRASLEPDPVAAQKHGGSQQTIPQPSPEHADLKHPKASTRMAVSAEGRNRTARPGTPALERKDFAKRVTEEDGKSKANEVVDVEEREVEHKRPHGQGPAPKRPSEPPPRRDPDPQPASRLPPLNQGWPRTPRTDEAVWAAAALGFLLILLTLSVLHTRLYRHWRTTPSLYWRDPQQDYDSVADVIRRRLRITNRRRKRGRRQECVLLPSSSSSDEHP